MAEQHDRHAEVPLGATPTASPGARRQMEVYLAGLAGHRPTLPVAVEDLEQAARAAMSPEAYGYVAGAAGSGDTTRANRDAFRRWRLVPRHLRAISRRDLGIELLGRRHPAPVLLAPVGVQSIIHPDAELATAQAARAVGVTMVLSTASSRALEEVASALAGSPRWFQLYWPRDQEVTASLLARAERAGYEAVVVTLDTHLLGWREIDIQHAYLPFLRGEGLANYFSDPAFRSALKVPPEEDPRAAVLHFTQIFSNPALGWGDLAWLRRHTRLPVLLKGILHPDDARRAADHGADGVIVSNHGGRQVDGALAALDALPDIAEAVGGRLAVLFDSGVRRGADVIKALALGARAVLFGRPYCYGLALAGEAGVREVVLNLLADLDLTLGLIGHASVAELGRASVVETPAR